MVQPSAAGLSVGIPWIIGEQLLQVLRTSAQVSEQKWTLPTKVSMDQVALSLKPQGNPGLSLDLQAVFEL